jgi:23S rRNA (uracil1939-C5)-methyltransferase
VTRMEHEVPDRSPTLELGIDRVVAGGLGLGRDEDGRIVLVEGALPGERVRVRLTESKPKLARAVTTEVLVAAPERIDPPCPEVHAGCGGCDLQHATPGLQWRLKTAIVADALTRIGRLQGVPVVLGRRLDPTGYRTTLRCGVRDGRAGFRRHRSNEIHAVQTCLIAHPLVAEVVEDGRFPGVDEVTIRAGAGTGERLVIVSPTPGGTTVPSGVRVIGQDALASGGHAWFHEEVAGRRFRVSAHSFFQARPDGADALVDAVRRSLGSFDPTEDRLVDLYGGVGLFTGGLGARRATLVERSKSSTADARVNLEDLDAEICRVAVEKWRPTLAAAVVADPARSGLGKAGVAAVVATGAPRVALVSCDPASLARDARLLVDAGYEVLGVEVVDLFPQTHHIEAVTTLRRVRGTR